MAVKPGKESDDPISYLDFQKLEEHRAIRTSMETGDLSRFAETRNNSNEKNDSCFSEELKRFRELVESKSGEKYSDDRRFSSFVHLQVLKIREEDSHLGEDIGVGLSTREKLAFLHISSQMDALFYSRPILPSSPLGHKTAI